MARIVAYCAPAAGHLSVFLMILSELRLRGHEVLLVIHTRGPGLDLAAMEKLGIPVRERNRRGPTPAGPRGPSPAWDIVDEATSVEAVVAEERPDALLIDPFHQGAMIAAEASGLPWASIAHNPLLFRAPGDDARGPGLHPGRGPLRDLVRRVVVHGVRAIEGRLLPVINQARTVRGLEPISEPWEVFRRPPLVLAATAEPFEYPRDDWPASVRFVGPILRDAPAGADAGFLEALDERPLILLSDSTLTHAPRARSWVQVALAALASEPVQVVATVPNGTLAGISFPENVHVRTFLPHAAVLKRAACVVCHGGAGITQRALAAGVPVVAVPFAHDRFEVARRVEVAGAGVMLRGTRLDHRRMREAVGRAMTMRRGAQRIADAFALTSGAPGAADAVEALLDPLRRTPIPAPLVRAS